jgi:hypothetical protein
VFAYPITQLGIESIAEPNIPGDRVDTISTHVDAFITNASPSSKLLKNSRYA